MTVDEFVLWSHCNTYRYGLGDPELYRVTVALEGWQQPASVVPAGIPLAMVSPATTAVVGEIYEALQRR